MQQQSDTAEARPAAQGPFLRIRGLSKFYPGTRALHAVDLDLCDGRVHGLIGGNGSGKSTLVKILSGIEVGEPGGVLSFRSLDVPAESVSARAARLHGVRVVHQELGVFPGMTVAENLSIGSGFEHGVGGRIAWSAVRARADALIGRFEIPARSDTVLGDMSPAGQALVAIARALQDLDSARSGLLLLDEPTASLPRHEVQYLLASVRRLAAQGQGVLYVSHRLDEIKDVTDDVTVLRDGALVGTFPTSTLTADSLVELIAGRPVEQKRRGPINLARSGAPALNVQHLRLPPLRDVSFEVGAGEIVGIAGLLGSGRSELLRCIFGDLPTESGVIEIKGAALPSHDPCNAMDAGVAFVPENRLADALFAKQSVAENLTSATIASYWQRLVYHRRTLLNDAERLARESSIKFASVEDGIATLSGGNQQKVVLARWLRRKPGLILLDEPTQGIDVGARNEIYSQIFETAESGAAILVVSSDFEELEQICDRVLVLRDGAIHAVLVGDEISTRRMTELSYPRNWSQAIASASVQKES